MTIAFNTAANTTLTAGTSATACNYTTPSGSSAGVWLFAFLTIYGDLSCAITPPTGWTLVPNSRIDHPNGGDDDITTAVYYLQTTSAPSATYSFAIAPGTFGGSGFDIVGIWASGVASLDFATTNDGYTGAVACTAGTTANANETLLAFYSVDEVAISTGPSGYAQLLNAGQGGFNFHGLYSNTQATAGGTGTPTCVPNAGYTDWTSTLFALVPSGGGTPYSESISESITSPSDSVVRVFVGARASAESISGASDAVARRGVFVRNVNETLATPSDNTVRVAQHARAIAEILSTPTDSLLRKLVLSRSIAEAITGPNDVPARVFAGARGVSESIDTPADTLARHAGRIRAIVETLPSPTDTLGRIFEGARSPSESVASPSDSVVQSTGGGGSNARSISESVATPSAAPARRGSYARQLAEVSGVLLDAVTRIVDAVRSIGESVPTPADAPAKLTAHPRSIGEAMASASDVLARAFIGVRVVFDSIGTPVDVVVGQYTPFLKPVYIFGTSIAIKTVYGTSIAIKTIKGTLKAG